MDSDDKLYEMKTDVKRWYQKNWAAWIFCFIFPPVGIFLMWKYSNHKLIVKILANVIFGGAFLIGLIFMSSSKSDEIVIRPSIQNDIKQEDKKIDVWGIGQWKVGQDIPAGQYLAFGTGYVEIAPDSSGNFRNIIMNDNITTRRYLTVYDGEYLKTKGNVKLCAATDAPKPDLSEKQISEGQYKVGEEIPAGEYKIQSLGKGYVEVSRDDRGGLNGIVTNEFMPEKISMYVTVEDGQYLRLINAIAYLP